MFFFGKSFFSKFSKTQRYLLLVALFAIFLSLIFLGIFKFNVDRQNKNKTGVNDQIIDKEIVDLTISFLNGLPLEEEDNRCVAVMIDNAPEVEKKFGLNNASLVYEAPVEGGRTRFMAIYHLSFATSTEQILGPVRSARPYYLDWVQELNCLYTHVGGSPEALQKIKNNKIFSLNQFYNGNYFWRDNKYTAPHSTFTTVEKLSMAFEEKNEQQKEQPVISWLFAKEEVKELQGGEGFFEEKIGDTKVSWLFDHDLKEWKRSWQGKQDKDNLGQITAKQVIFQYVNAKVLDEEGRLSLKTIGSGSAVILKGSRVIKGTWEKEGLLGRTKFFDSNNQEIEFNPGRIWIEIVGKF